MLNEKWYAPAGVLCINVLYIYVTAARAVLMIHILIQTAINLEIRKDNSLTTHEDSNAIDRIR